MMIPYKHDLFAETFFMDDKTATIAQAQEYFTPNFWPRYVQTLGGVFDTRGSQKSKLKLPLELTASYVFKNQNPETVRDHEDVTEQIVGKVAPFWFRVGNPLVISAVDSIRCITADAHLKRVQFRTPHGEWDQPSVKIVMTLEFPEDFTVVFAEYFGPEPVAPES